MPLKRGMLALVVICVAVVVLSLFGVASDFMTSLGLSLDGLLLILISLTMAAIFGLTLLSIAHDLGWLPNRHKTEASRPAAGARPAPKGAENANVRAEETVPVQSGEGK